MSRVKKTQSSNPEHSQARKRRKTFKDLAVMDTKSILALLKTEAVGEPHVALWNEPSTLAAQLRSVFEVVYPSLRLADHLETPPGPMEGHHSVPGTSL